MGTAASQYRKRRPRVGWSCHYPGSGSASCIHDYLATRKHLAHPPSPSRRKARPLGLGATHGACVCVSTFLGRLPESLTVLPSFPWSPRTRVTRFPAHPPSGSGSVQAPLGPPLCSLLLLNKAAPTRAQALPGAQLRAFAPAAPPT